MRSHVATRTVSSVFELDEAIAIGRLTEPYTQHSTVVREFLLYLPFIGIRPQVRQIERSHAMR